ncbi:formate hydrogenlyase transcriptional activator FhlA [Klebsiella michiganensis]|nr:formate hydrogenlyase transcriptional activator FhlA [Klebsiella michiganensis]
MPAVSGRNIDSIPAETLRLLSRMEWPGNVRELENVIERAVLLTRGSVLQLSLPEMSIETEPLAAEVLPEEGEDEYQLIVRVLKESNGVVAGPKGAAQRLGLKRTTLLSRMKRLGINKDQPAVGTSSERCFILILMKQRSVRQLALPVPDE